MKARDRGKEPATRGDPPESTPGVPPESTPGVPPESTPGVPPEGLAARRLALSLLAGVWREGRMLSELESAPGRAARDTTPEDRARAGRLARATLRQAHRADAALRPHLHHAPRPEIRDILRLATVELLGEGAAAHGVVHSAVALARARQPRASGMVNAVLRRVAETGAPAWAAAPPQRLPNWLRGRLCAAWGNARVARMEAVFAAQPPLDLTPRDAADGAALAADLGGVLLDTGSVRLTGGAQVSALAGYDTGRFWVQDAAAALPARAIDIRPGLRVLDLCAAPGGKTMQLAAAGAEVTALDLSPRRLERLAANLARTGLTAQLVAANALEWQAEAPFDAVLLDAPCSATGTIRRHPDLPWLRDGSGITPLIAVQAALIDRARALLRSGGQLIYCTCSLLPEEGERQIAAALSRHEDLHPDPVAIARLGGGLAEWAAGPGMVRITPETWQDSGGIDGFLIAALRRGPDGGA